MYSIDCFGCNIVFGASYHFCLKMLPFYVDFEPWTLIQMMSVTRLDSSGIPIELAVVIPTYNERNNILPLLEALEVALQGTVWEAVFVDDNSPDGTADHIREIAMMDRRIRVLERIGRRGLSSACIEGMLATSARYIAVMDGDLQHDERILKKMLAKMKAERLDIVIGTRRAEGGSMEGMSRQRIWLSECGTQISRLVCHCNISDPMSGFFLVDRVYLERVLHRLTGTGFKILIDLLASSSHPVRFAEIPYHFRQRKLGASKLDLNTQLAFLYLLADKVVGKSIPTRFVLFVFVGSLGLLLHLGILALLYYLANESFVISQIEATVVAMTFNFSLNNIVTFQDRRLRGWNFVSGLLTFYVACSLGALINTSFATFLLRSHIPWYLAGLSGMSISSIWNFGVSSVLTWKYSQPHT